MTPIVNDLPEASSDFPMNIIMNTIPKKAEFTTMPKKSTKLAYGKYLLIMASCTGCNIKQEKGAAIEGMELAGGFEFPLHAGGTVRSANITSDQETGIGSWNEQAVVSRFKMYADSAYKPQSIARNQFNTVMPWLMHSRMQEEDLNAIYAYLQTVKAVKNEVLKFSAN